MYEKEERSEKREIKNRLEREEQFEELLRNLSREGQAIAAKDYSTVDEAQTIKTEFIERATVGLKSVEGVGNIPLRISGEGILVPQIAINDIDLGNDSTAIGVSLDKESYVPLAPFDSLEVNIKGILGSISVSEDGMHNKINLHYSMHKQEPLDTGVGIEGIPILAAAIYVVPIYLMECSERNSIEIVSLEQERSRRELANELASSGLARTTLKRKLDKLNSAFHAEDSKAYSDLINIKLLHEIGSLSDQYARRGSKYSYLLSRAVLDVIKRGRFVQISGAALQIGDKPDLTHVILNGSVVDVLMPDSETDATKPAIVLDAPNKGGESELYSFAFDQISGLKF